MKIVDFFYLGLEGCKFAIIACCSILPANKRILVLLVLASTVEFFSFVVVMSRRSLIQGPRPVRYFDSYLILRLTFVAEQYGSCGLAEKFSSSRTRIHVI